MSKQRYINTKFWDDSYVSDLDPSEKLLFLYCITNPATNISGAYEIPLKRIATDTGFDKEMVLKIFLRFEKDEKIIYKEGWLVILNFIKHQQIKSDTIIKGINENLKDAPEWIIDTLSIRYGGDIIYLTKLNLIETELNSIETESEPEKTKPIRQKIPPDYSDVSEYIKENCFDITPDEFIDCYSARGWMVGKLKMKDWQASVRTFVRNKKEWSKNKSSVKNVKPSVDYQAIEDRLKEYER